MRTVSITQSPATRSTDLHHTTSRSQRHRRQSHTTFHPLSPKTHPTFRVFPSRNTNLSTFKPTAHIPLCLRVHANTISQTRRTHSIIYATQALHPHHNTHNHRQPTSTSSTQLAMPNTSSITPPQPSERAHPSTRRHLHTPATSPISRNPHRPPHSSTRHPPKRYPPPTTTQTSSPPPRHSSTPAPTDHHKHTTPNPFLKGPSNSWSTAVALSIRIIAFKTFTISAPALRPSRAATANLRNATPSVIYTATSNAPTACPSSPRSTTYTASQITITLYYPYDNLSNAAPPSGSVPNPASNYPTAHNYHTTGNTPSTFFPPSLSHRLRHPQPLLLSTRPPWIPPTTPGKALTT